MAVEGFWKAWNQEKKKLLSKGWDRNQIRSYRPQFRENYLQTVNLPKEEQTPRVLPNKRGAKVDNRLNRFVSNLQATEDPAEKLKWYQKIRKTKRRHNVRGSFVSPEDRLAILNYRLSQTADPKRQARIQRRIERLMRNNPDLGNNNEDTPTDVNEGDNVEETPPEPLPRTDYPAWMSDPNTLQGLFPHLFGSPVPVEESPLYKLQREQGLKDLTELMASRGLTGSGAEIEGSTRLLNELGAKEAERQSRISQTEGERLLKMLQEADTLMNLQNNQQYQNLLGLAKLALSQDPSLIGLKASHSLGSVLGSLSKTLAGYQSQNYSRPSVGIPGVVDSALPPFIPPFPSSPNLSYIDAITAFMQPAISQVQNSYLPSLFNLGIGLLGG